MIRQGIKLGIALLFFHSSFAQPAIEKWDLRKCVEYALEHNISVRQADLQIRFAELDFKQSKMAQYPTANLNSNLGYSVGSNQDPTSFSLITSGFLFNNYSLQTGVDLFNWFTKKNTVAVKDLNLKATQAGVEKAKNDIALNVAVAYLQILLAKEQVNLASAKVIQTKAQLESTRKQVEAGNLPELSAANLESLLASDSSSLIGAETAVQKSLLQLKALLNLDAGLPFEIVTPSVQAIPVENLADLQPEAVYNLAIANMPQQKVDELNLKAALKSVQVARGSMYPTISLFGSLGSRFNSKSKEIRSITQKTSTTAFGTVLVNGTPYQVYPYYPEYTYGKIKYFDQLDQNFNQSIGISISVPILMGGTLRTEWQRSKLNVKQVELTKEQNSFTLKQDIYTAYNDAVAAVQKFNADKKAVEASQKAYDFAMKRYDLGLLSTYDLITTQTSLQQAKTQLLYSQYDFVFKMKLLEFYRGQGLKL
ncbi:MAG TPA: TolC family protein [Chitinophagaceae bacterium]|nr:TolC family protein [Chitinophagaceae bacterium]